MEALHAAECGDTADCVDSGEDTAGCGIYQYLYCNYDSRKTRPLCLHCKSHSACKSMSSRKLKYIPGARFTEVIVNEILQHMLGHSRPSFSTKCHARQSVHAIASHSS